MLLAAVARLVAKKMRAAGAGVAAVTMAHGAARAQAAARGVEAAPKSGGKAKMRDILELAFGGIRIAEGAASALGGTVLEICPCRWTDMSMAAITCSTL